MKKVSKSPDRHLFQKQNYIKRQQDKNLPVSDAYMDFFDQIINEHKNKFEDEESRKNNLEYDLLTTDWILQKARSSESYAQNLYASMCNMRWCRHDMWPILKEEYWHCTWRYAGGIVADMRQQGDYIDWYCSGIRDMSLDEEENKVWDANKFVQEGHITEEIREDMKRLGWISIPYDEDDK